MALRAGYYGIKKSVLDKLLGMAGSLVIKSLGTALSLSDAGELRVRNASASQSGVVRPDGETLVIEGGLLKVAGGSGYTRDTLFTGNVNLFSVNDYIDFPLSEDIADYDVICIKTKITPAAGAEQILPIQEIYISSDTVLSGDTFLLSDIYMYNNAGIYSIGVYTNETLKLKKQVSSWFTAQNVIAIYGLKF